MLKRETTNHKCYTQWNFFVCRNEEKIKIFSGHRKLNNLAHYDVAMKTVVRSFLKKELLMKKESLEMKNEWRTGKIRGGPVEYTLLIKVFSDIPPMNR